MFENLGHENVYIDSKSKLRQELKARGVKRGWPDVLVFKAGPHGSSWTWPLSVKVIGIELKAEKGTQSDDQKAVEKAFIRVGATYALARSVDDVTLILRRHEVIP